MFAASLWCLLACRIAVSGAQNCIDLLGQMSCRIVLTYISTLHSSQFIRSLHSLMPLHRVAVYACRLVIRLIPEPRIVRPIMWVDMVHALGNDGALAIEMQLTYLVIGLAQKPFRILIPP